MYQATEWKDQKYRHTQKQMQFKDDSYVADLIGRTAAESNNALRPFGQQYHIGTVTMVN